ncbi:MAG: nuclear transport factor 2 family protein [Xenococcaceae cyanobacterium]
MSEQTIKEVVSAYFNQMQAMNPIAWAENFTEDALIYDPVGKPPNKARENSEKFFAMLSIAFAKFELQIDNLFVAGNSAAVKWTMRGWGKNGKKGETEGISVFEMHESGKIQQVSSYWDDKAIIAQIKD